jgi:protein-S-isoprenylcysteine O-methyltransferase Ste14
MSGDKAFGRTLFRFRSFTPVPVVLALAALLAQSRAQPGPGGPAVDELLNLVGLALLLSGQALRLHVLGQVPEGTSGQGDRLEAVTLNCTGPYARVRNPLYVGNALICTGLLAIAWDPWVAVLGLAFFFGQYHFIIRAEEVFLLSRFGDRFADYVRSVPRWIPRLSPVATTPLSARFDWRRALKKEHNPFAAWASGALLLYGWELAARRPDAFEATLPVLLGAELAVAVFFVAVKGWKHRWLASGRPDAT